MNFVSNDNGKMIYRCPKCGVKIQYSQHIYEGKVVADKIYCKNCAANVVADLQS